MAHCFGSVFVSIICVFFSPYQRQRDKRTQVLKISIDALSVMFGALDLPGILWSLKLGKFRESMGACTRRRMT